MGVARDGSSRWGGGRGQRQPPGWAIVSGRWQWHIFIHQRCQPCAMTHSWDVATYVIRLDDVRVADTSPSACRSVFYWVGSRASFTLWQLLGTISVRHHDPPKCFGIVYLRPTFVLPDGWASPLQCMRRKAVWGKGYGELLSKMSEADTLSRKHFQLDCYGHGEDIEAVRTTPERPLMQQMKPVTGKALATMCYPELLPNAMH